MDVDSFVGSADNGFDHCSRKLMAWKNKPMAGLNAMISVTNPS
jgi:hypothetical protein